jgi:hypothetical protein
MEITNDLIDDIVKNITTIHYPVQTRDQRKVLIDIIKRNNYTIEEKKRKIDIARDCELEPTDWTQLNFNSCMKAYLIRDVDKKINLYEEAIKELELNVSLWRTEYQYLDEV